MSDEAAEVLWMVRGAWVTLALRGACALGVFDALAEPTALDRLAARTDTDPATLARLLRVLADVGLVEHLEQERYVNTARGSVLRTDHPSRIRDLALMQATLPNLGAWCAVDDAVRRGSGVFEQVNGTSSWEQLAGDPEAQTRFNAAMARRAADQVTALLAAVDLTGGMTLVDIGGGRGAMVVLLLEAVPGLRVVLADQPVVAAEAEARFADAHLTDRASVVPCDFFSEVPGGGDVYTIANVLHDWDDDASVAILRTVRSAMPDHARLLIIEHVLDAPGRTAAQQRDVHLVDLHMLVMFGGRERTQVEYDALLAAAGFTSSSLAATGTDWNVLEARPAER